jgi:hypothetical protein
MCDGAGLCIGSPKNCDDSLPCTIDTCNPGDGACVNTSMTGAPCDDGDECTLGDRCQADGTCDGTPKDCSDGNECTIDTCDPPTGICTNTPDTGRGCDDGDACTLTDTCQSDGTCVGDPVLDDNEPNGSAGTATLLGSIFSDETYPAGSDRGTINPQGEGDWFYFNLRDDLVNTLRPTAELNDIPAGNDYDLCVYFVCNTGTGLTLTCSQGAPDSSHGMDGCCSTNSGSSSELVILLPDCDDTSDDSGTVYVEVSWVSGPGNCTDPFEVLWGDN